MSLDLQTVLSHRLHSSLSELTAFCQRWHISEFSFFGSVVRSDFHSDSDVDVLITFDRNWEWGLTEMMQMQDELEAMFDRPVDLIVKEAIERSPNWIRKQQILQDAQVVYATR